MDINKIRYKILKEAKNHIVNHGWNDQLFYHIRNNSKFNFQEIESLFPGGYKDLMKLYFEEINSKMSFDAKKIDLIRLKVHERIRELCILRLKIMLNEKRIIIKTLLNLMIPNNYDLSYKILYNTVDQIWFLAGDNSTDFNFYTKRAILASIYTSVIIHFINNDNLDETIFILNKHLKKVSIIPNIKRRFSDLNKLIPQAIRFRRNFARTKQ